MVIVLSIVTAMLIGFGLFLRAGINIKNPTCFYLRTDEEKIRMRDDRRKTRHWSVGRRLNPYRGTPVIFVVTWSKNEGRSQRLKGSMSGHQGGNFILKGKQFQWMYNRNTL